MARNPNRNNSSSRRRGGTKPGKSNSTLYIIIGSILILVLIGFIIWALLPPPPSAGRVALDKYVELSQTENTLGDGASVYVDMSNGMISAYGSDQSKADLQAIINKLAAVPAIQFYGLASGVISEINLSHVDLYNYMLDPNNYSQMQAPIEETLQRIVSTDQPALLMSDFEEYNNGKIQTAAYAKRYFIEWLAKGYNITFYKWDYVEGNKPKHMFFAVFDDNANRLNSLVENAVKTVDPSIDTFVLGSRDFAYPLATNYYYIDKEGVVQGLSLKQGGNYHNSDGKDYVTFVMENGGEEDYKCYANTYASATGTQGQFAPLDIRLGSLAEYYPIGVKWTDAISEAKARETSTIEGDQFKHLIGNLYIDFSAQNGYEIMDIEVRTFDIQNIINYVNEEQEIDDGIEAPEINEILVAGMENARIYPGWTHIFVNFDEKFNGSFPKGVPSCDMLRANIVISKASPNLYGADEFFGWPGNPSLSNSVREALTANTSNPAGRILFTYYIKSIAE